MENKSLFFYEDKHLTWSIDRHFPYELRTVELGCSLLDISVTKILDDPGHTYTCDQYLIKNYWSHRALIDFFHEDGDNYGIFLKAMRDFIRLLPVYYPHLVRVLKSSKGRSFMDWEAGHGGILVAATAPG